MYIALCTDAELPTRAGGKDADVRMYVENMA